MEHGKCLDGSMELTEFAFVLKASNELPIRLSESCAMLPSQHLPS